jgi:hypothetical protein
MFSRENTILSTQSLNSIFAPLPVSTISEEKQSKCGGYCRCCSCSCCCKSSRNSDENKSMNEPIMKVHYTFHAENPQRISR